MKHSSRMVVFLGTALLVLGALLIPTSCARSAISPSDDVDVAHAAAKVNYDYMNYSNVKSALFSIESAHPDIAKVYDIGDSWEKTQNKSNRDILALKLSDNVLMDEDEPEVLVMSLHHAREWISSEVVVAAMRNLTDSYGIDSRASWLVDNREVWFVPVVNPDGLDYSLTYDSWWRKNRRDNLDGTFGVDLNRNYGGSMNNDSAGAWGGEGSSHYTFDEVYCGVSAFSEPETQAIMNLVIQRNFVMALDFHSYSELVMWPWGYTSNVTSDDAALVSIGTQLASLNGYTPEQSIGLYPTTGDSLDWLYGYARIFGFTFEVATSFHPLDAAVAQGVVDLNVPPLIMGIEIAGDREQRPFSIDHAPSPVREYSSLGFGVDANITAARGVNSSANKVVYRVDGGSWRIASMVQGPGNDSYSSKIPSQPVGSVVDYYIVARDSSGVELMSPRYAPYETMTFTVVDTTPPIAEAGSDFECLLGETVTLDASGSFDSAGILDFKWSFTYNGSQVELSGETVTFTFWSPGEYVILLTVSDSSGNSGVDTVTARVQDAYIPEFGGAVLIVVASVLLMVVSSWSRKRRSRLVKQH